MIALKTILVILLSTAHAAPHAQAQFPEQPITVYRNQTVSAFEVTEINKPAAFASDYVLAREIFRQKSAMLKKKFPGAQLGFYKVPSKIDSDLTTDFLFIPGKDKKKLFIVSSGIHGAEALTGNILQTILLEKFQNLATPMPFNVLVIHALNPYGFKYMRRANENNVDLNRNFARTEDFQSDNKEYEKLKYLLEPDNIASSYLLSRIGFFAKTLWVNIRDGRKTILGALRGQYKNPKGLFYGGTEPQAETKTVQKLIIKYADSVDYIFQIDLHTGFGEAGHLHYFGSDNNVSEEQKNLTQFIFNDQKIDTGSDKNFYSTTGAFGDWLVREYPKKKIIPMTFEFGTMNSQTLNGGLKSLWTIVLDNQGAQNGFLSIEDQKTSLTNMESLFNPQDSAWQKTVVQSGTRAIEQGLTRFAELR